MSSSLYTGGSSADLQAPSAKPSTSMAKKRKQLTRNLAAPSSPYAPLLATLEKDKKMRSNLYTSSTTNLRPTSSSSLSSQSTQLTGRSSHRLGRSVDIGPSKSAAPSSRQYGSRGSFQHHPQSAPTYGAASVSRFTPIRSFNSKSTPALVRPRASTSASTSRSQTSLHFTTEMTESQILATISEFQARKEDAVARKDFKAADDALTAINELKALLSSSRQKIVSDSKTQRMRSIKQQQAMEEAVLAKRWQHNYQRHEAAATALRRELQERQQEERERLEAEVDSKLIFHPSKALLELSEQIDRLSRSERYKEAEIVQAAYDKQEQEEFQEFENMKRLQKERKLRFLQAKHDKEVADFEFRIASDEGEMNRVEEKSFVELRARFRLITQMEEENLSIGARKAKT